MKWLLIIGFSATFQGSAIEVVEFGSEEACLAAEAKIESESALPTRFGEVEPCKN